MRDARMEELVETLFPICRSITGDGIRETLNIILQRIPLNIVNVPSGTKVLDWEIPKVWNIRDAYIKDADGHRVVDFNENNLHVVSYSRPVSRSMSLEELRPHLHSLPAQPDLIPYRTSYYDDSWGFCLQDSKLQGFENGSYDVKIDSSLEDGDLCLGEYYIPGQSKSEVLFSTHICHPSLCNDNLSGIAVATYLADYVSRLNGRYSYRFLFVPVTIGAIAWLALNEQGLENIRHGLVLSNLADHGRFNYKKTRSGTAGIDCAVEYVLRHSGAEYAMRDFVPYGYDERQYNSPGFNLPVGCLSRTPYGEYPEYHTSGDNLSFISHENLAESLQIYKDVVDVLERGRYFRNLLPKGEPQLGKRGLYKKVGGEAQQKVSQMAMLWLLNKSDSTHSLLDISEQSGIALEKLTPVADMLVSHGLLEEVSA